MLSFKHWQKQHFVGLFWANVVKDGHLPINFIDGRERGGQHPIYHLEDIWGKNINLTLHPCDSAVQLPWKILNGSVQVALTTLQIFPKSIIIHFSNLLAAVYRHISQLQPTILHCCPQQAKRYSWVGLLGVSHLCLQKTSGQLPFSVRGKHWRDDQDPAWAWVLIRTSQKKALPLFKEYRCAKF